MIKKRIGVLAVLVVVSIVGISLVTAGFWDFLKTGEDEGLEGELHEEVDVSVTLTNAPPVILAVYQVEDNEGGASPDEVQPLDGDAPDNINNARIYFKVSDPNGRDDLPGDPAIPITQSVSIGDLGTSSNIEIYVSVPAVDCVAENKLADAGSCQREAACPKSGSCSSNEMEFSCTVPVDYFDEPGTWSIYVGVADGGSATDDNSDLGPGDGDPVDPNSFDVLSNSHFIIGSPVGGITFINIDLSSTDQDSNNDPLVLENRGNIDFTSGTLQASYLTSDDVPGGGDDMSSTAFSVSVLSGGECDEATNADTLDTTPVIVDAAGTPNLPYGRCNIPGANEELYFCIWQQLDTTGLSFDNTYSSSATKGTTPGTPGHAWELLLS